jgi:FtsH-binding integral membrane protein
MAGKDGALAPETIGNIQEKPNIDNVIGKSKTNEMEMRSIDVPPEIRRGYATKIWLLVTLQMCATFVITVIIEWKAPWIENIDTRQRLFIAVSFFAMVQVLLLFVVRKMNPFNYIVYFTLIPGQALMWGCTRYIIKYQFNCNLTGIIVVSMILTLLENIFHVHDALGNLLKPKGAKNLLESGNAVKTRNGEEPKGKLANAMKAVSQKESVRLSTPPDAKASLKEKIMREREILKAEAIVDLHHSNDGLMRATMVLAFLNWFIATCIALGFSSWMQKQTHIPMHAHVHPAAGIIASFCALFIILFFHFDCERVMRRCNLDDYFRPVCHLNGDIVVAIFALYTLAFLTATVMAGAEDAAGGAAEGA